MLTAEGGGVYKQQQQQQQQQPSPQQQHQQYRLININGTQHLITSSKPVPDLKKIQHQVFKVVFLNFISLEVDVSLSAG